MAEIQDTNEINNMEENDDNVLPVPMEEESTEQLVEPNSEVTETTDLKELTEESAENLGTEVSAQPEEQTTGEQTSEAVEIPEAEIPEAENKSSEENQETNETAVSAGDVDGGEDGATVEDNTGTDQEGVSASAEQEDLSTSADQEAGAEDVSTNADQGDGATGDVSGVQEEESVPMEEGDGGAAEVIAEENLIKITVTSQNDEKEISVGQSTGVNQLRSVVGVKFNILLDQVCLIYRGKLLTDDQTLETVGVTEGDQIHLIIRYAPPQQNVDFTQSSIPTTGPTQFSRLGLGAGDFVQLQSQLQKQMMANPEMVRQMMSNPLVQQLMANPKVMKDMIMDVPQSREMLEKNPDIAEMLNNPDIMKQTLEAARNPAALEDLLEKMDKTEPTAEELASGQPAAAPGLTMPNIPSSQTMLRMMSQKPQMLQQLLNAPYMSTMMEGLAANPQWAQQMIAQNPLFASNPLLQQQMAMMIPHYLQQMQNPSVVALMKNTKALQALLRIQHGVDVLQSEAPNLVQSIGLPYLSMPSQLGMHVASTPSAGDAESNGFPGMGPNQPDPMSIMMSQMIQQIANDKIGQPAEQRYTEQLDLMSTMGFHDRQENLKVLTSTFGDVDAAVSRMLNQLQ